VTGASITFPSRRVSITFTDGTTRRRLSDSRSITRDATDAGCGRACDGAATATPRSAHSAADITTVIAIAYRVRVEVIWFPLRASSRQRPIGKRCSIVTAKSEWSSRREEMIGDCGGIVIYPRRLRPGASTEAK
jgi:hypothetical protein